MRGVVHAGGRLPSLNALGDGATLTKTKQRYARSLRYAKAHGWRVSKRYAYTRDPSGRADDMAVDLVRTGVVGSWIVKTDHGRHLDHAYVKLT